MGHFILRGQKVGHHGEHLDQGDKNGTFFSLGDKKWDITERHLDQGDTNGTFFL